MIANRKFFYSTAPSRTRKFNLRWEKEVMWCHLFLNLPIRSHHMLHTIQWIVNILIISNNSENDHICSIRDICLYYQTNADHFHKFQIRNLHTLLKLNTHKKNKQVNNNKKKRRTMLPKCRDQLVDREKKENKRKIWRKYVITIRKYDFYNI